MLEGIAGQHEQEVMREKAAVLRLVRGVNKEGRRSRRGETTPLMDPAVVISRVARRTEGGVVCAERL